MNNGRKKQIEDIIASLECMISDYHRGVLLYAYDLDTIPREAVRLIGQECGSDMDFSPLDMVLEDYLHGKEDGVAFITALTEVKEILEQIVDE